MTKKLSLLLTAVAVLAFAAPSMAMAEKSTLTELQGGVMKPLPVGATIVMTGTEISLTSTLVGRIPCKKLNLKAGVIKNEDNNVEAGGNNVGPAAEDCTNGTKVFTITSVTIESLRSSESGKGTFTFLMKTDIGTELECTFSGTNVPFTYISGTSVITFNKNGPIKGAPAACGSATLDGEFKLETENGTAVVFD